MVLGKFGRYQLQQVLCFYNRAVKMPNSRLVRLAMIDGAHLQDNHVMECRKSARAL